MLNMLRLQIPKFYLSFSSFINHFFETNREIKISSDGKHSVCYYVNTISKKRKVFLDLVALFAVYISIVGKQQINERQHGDRSFVLYYTYIKLLPVLCEFLLIVPWMVTKTVQRYNFFYLSMNKQNVWVLNKTKHIFNGLLLTVYGNMSGNLSTQTDFITRHIFLKQSVTI